MMLPDQTPTDDPHATRGLRSALAADADGAWSEQLAQRLATLAKRAEQSAMRLTSRDLADRCSALAQGAHLSADLLRTLRVALAAPARAPALSPQRLHAGSAIDTASLLRIGWLGIESGFADDGLAIVEAVGTLLHGRLGGMIYKAHVLLATGCPDRAARVMKEGLALDADPDGIAAATLAWLCDPRLR